SHGNRVRIVTGRGDGSVAEGGLRVIPAGVAGGHDDHDSRIPGGFHGLAQRIGLVASGDRPPEREVHDTNVVLVLDLDGALDGGNDIAVLADAIAVQHAQVDQVGVGRDSAERDFVCV